MSNNCFQEITPELDEEAEEENENPEEQPATSTPKVGNKLPIV